MKANFQNRTLRTWIPTATFQHPAVGYHLPTSGSWISTSKFRLLRVGSRRLGIQPQSADLRKLASNFQLITARHFDFATKTTKGARRKQQRSRLQTSLVGRAGPRGSSRAPTGVRGRFFQAAFPHENCRFFAFLHTFLREKSLETAGQCHIL